MNKTAFTIFYLACSILGMTGFLKHSLYAYIEHGSVYKIINDHLLMLVCSGILTGVLLFFLYKKWLPDQYAKRKDKLWFKIIMPILYLFFGFVMNTGMLMHKDLFFANTDKLQINGIIMSKSMGYNAKGGNRYFVSIYDTVSALNYHFDVKKRVFENVRRGDKVEKQFTISKLGIIYRKEE